jgi:RsiW-degrading membrane proteinase PrsW (M82 family)
MRKLLLLTLGLLAATPTFAKKITYAEWVNYSQAVMSLTILLLIAIVGTMALRWTYKNRYLTGGGKATFRKYAWQNPLVKLGIFVAVIVLTVNLLLPNPFSSKSLHDIGEISKLRKMPQMAEEAYRRLAEEYPGLPKYHFEYLAAHYQREDWALESGEVDANIDPSVEDPKRYYIRLGNEKNPRLQDMSRLGLGIASYYTKQTTFAMAQLSAITDENVPYRHLFMGRMHLGWRELDSAEYHFRKEIALGEAIDLTVNDMAWMMYFQQPDSFDKMQRLITDSTLHSYVPQRLKRYLYTKKSEIVPYMKVIVGDWWANIQWIGLLGALMGTILWMLFLRKLDPNRQEPWLLLLGTFTGGAVFAFFALVLYDFVHFELGFYNDGSSFFHDFAYCVFGIGAIEELVKIIPFLLVLQFTKRLDKPINYLLYASASAMGFAFVENLMYFDESHVGIMHGRILLCVVFHMFATSTIAFAMMLGKLKYRKMQLPLFLVGYLIASFFHGFYDFWLISDSVGPFVFLTYAFFIYATFQYAAYLNNGLNHTNVSKGQVVLNPSKLASFLTVGLIAVLLFEYFGLSLVYGPSIGNYSLLNSLGMGSFLMFFVVLNLTNIDVVQGEWIWLRLWDFGSRVHHNRALGTRLKLIAKTMDSILAPLLPADGEVISRISLNGDNRYFLFKLDQPLVIQGQTMEYVLLRAKKDGEIPEPKQNVEAMVIAFRDKESLTRKAKRKADFKHLDNVLIQ